MYSVILARDFHSEHRDGDRMVDDDEEDTDMQNLSGPFFHKHVALRTVVATVCCLSMIGALLIIFSYICIRNIRTKAREILVNLSVADFGVACANFIGATVYFDQYIRTCHTSSGGTHSWANDSNDSNDSSDDDIHYSSGSCQVLENLCTAQAFFAGYFTLASVLWTLFLSVYIYCLVVHSSRKVHLKVVYFAYLFSWGMPLLISLWLVATDRLGYSPHGSSGWCSLKIGGASEKENIFVVVFGNDLWIYLTFVMVTILYLTTHWHIRFQLQEANPMLLTQHNKATLHNADTKFLLIPFAFLLLRVWSIILVFFVVYLRIEPPGPLSKVLLYAAGIGDSGQGFVNALLFCVFTPKVRERLLQCLKDSRCWQCCGRYCGNKRQYINLQDASLGSNSSYSSPRSSARRMLLT